MNTIEKISFYGKRVLIRVDFNVPLSEKGVVVDNSRIMAAIPTIKHVVNSGGKAIVVSHLGRPKNGPEEQFSLKWIVFDFKKLLNQEVFFHDNCIGKEAVLKTVEMKNGEVLLLENLRFYKEEVSGCVDFAKKLSLLGDVYINDAFGTVHRPHASTAIVARFFVKNKYFGFLLEKEIRSLKKALSKPERPFTAIIGGAKIAGKIDVIKSLFDVVDNLIVGGGMAYTFIKALGGDIGKSMVDEEKIVLAKQLIDKAKKKNVKLLLPVDSLNSEELKNNSKTTVSSVFSIEKNNIGLDIGPDSIDLFCKTIKSSKTLIWNGPMGVFEMSTFAKGTKKIGEAICLATKKGAFSLVGGGDSISALKRFDFTQHISYISTGGGAMLEYLEGKDLPGLVAITDF